MQKSFKEVIYRIMMPTDMSPSKPLDLLKKEHNVEVFEKEDEIVVHLDYITKKDKKVITGRYIPGKSKKDSVE